jgi:hypothetical protein
MTAKLNLPELPEGYFWRIVPRYACSDVQVRRKRLLGSDLVAEEMVVSMDIFSPESPEMAIQRAAQRALKSFRIAQRNQAIADYRGDHR